YERPLNRFVADFIGETNLLDVTVESVSGDRCLCRLPGGGTLACQASGTPVPGAAGHVSIRPERLSLTRKSQGDEPLAGALERTVYLGTDTQYVVRLDDGPEVTVRSQNAHRTALDVNAGDRVALEVDAGAARLLVD
ncbi:MAG: TOBE domain-containing protein, partial [Pseudomonadota bacterium]